MRLWRLVGPFAAPLWWRIATALTVGVIGVTLDLLRPWPLKVIVDNVMTHKHHVRLLPEALALQAFGRDPAHLLAASVAAIVSIAVLKGAADFCGSSLLTRAGQRVVFGLRCALFAHVQRLSLSFHSARRTGELLARITTDIASIETAVTSGLSAAVSNSLSLAGMIVIMALMDWQFALLALSVTPLLFGVVYYYTRRIKRAARTARRREGEVAAHAAETLSAVSLVQAFAREPYEDERFRACTERSLDANLETAALQAQFSPLVDIVVAVGTAAIVLAGTERVLAGSLTVGGLLVSLSYLALMYGPMRQISKLSATMSRATTSAERIVEIMRTSPTVCDAPDAVELPPSPPARIEFAGVAFEYETGRSVLHGIDLCVAPGETIAFVGPTGAGKSTLVNLLQRFYDPSAGRITIDGIPLAKIRLASLRSHIAVVPQESVLFATTVRENIAYGCPAATFEEIVGAAREANAHEFILGLPLGYETVVGERGATISGGQRQRIAIARAMIRRSPILILDEPTSSLDVAAETLIFEALERLRRGRTTFVVAHKLATVRSADRIVVLDGGRLVEQGTHAELIAHGSHYRAVLNMQFGARTEEFIT